MQENINIPDSNITTDLTFRNLCFMNMQRLTNFPYIEKDFDAISDYQLLCKVVEYLNMVIKNSNDQNDSITNLYNSFVALQTYVNSTKDNLEDAFNALDNYVRNYFANLDVQEEINNKLDEMVEDGTLEHIIASYLQTQKIYNTHTEMVADASSLVDGLTVQTLGYYSINDGGGAFYKITDTESITDYQEEIDTDLYATLITNELIHPEIFGAYGDGIHDDHDAIETALTEYGKVDFIQNKTYKTESTIQVKYNNIINGNNSLIIGDNETAYPLFTILGETAPASRTKIIMQDLRLECGTDINTRIHSGILCIHAADFIIRNVYVRYATYGFHFKNSLLFTFENCHVQNTNIALYNDDVSLSTCNNVKFDKCVFVANKDVLNSVNFAFKNALFVNCEIEANNSDGDAVINIPNNTGGTGTAGTSLIFDSCWFEANTPRDIKANVDQYNPISVTNCFITHPANTAYCFATSTNENFSMILDRCQDRTTYIDNAQTIVSDSDNVIITNCNSRLPYTQLGSAKGIYDNFGVKNKETIMSITVCQNGSTKKGRIEGSSNYVNLRSDDMNGIRFVDCSYQHPIVFGGGNAFMWVNGSNLYVKAGSAPTSGTDGTLLVGV